MGIHTWVERIQNEWRSPDSGCLLVGKEVQESRSPGAVASKEVVVVYSIARDRFMGIHFIIC